LHGYEAGADECIVKPIGRGLMRAKIRAWLRRSWTVSTDVLSPLDAAGLRLDPGQRQLSTPAGATIKLTNLEVRLLYLLMSHPGQVFRSEEIVARVWGYETDQEGALIKHLVYRVRHKVEPAPGHPRYVQTADGGYVFPRS
jgi:DNA-binding response OmpR family regulator